MPETIQISRLDNVAEVVLNRSDKHNALSLDMFEEIVLAGQALGVDASVRCILLRGAGSSFCAGLDSNVMKSLIVDKQSAKETLGRLFKRDDGPDNIAQRVAYVWQKINVPVIAALHGAVYGGGLQIALGADIRIAAPDTQFSIMESRYGLIPDMSITQTLPDIMRKDKALELALTGRIFAAGEALELGVITEIDDDPAARALSLAKEIATKSPDATRATKQLFRDSWRLGASESLGLEEKLQRDLIGSKNQIEAVMASIEKRDAKFS